MSKIAKILRKSPEVQELLLSLSRMVLLVEDESVCRHPKRVASCAAVVNARQLLYYHRTGRNPHG